MILVWKVYGGGSGLGLWWSVHCFLLLTLLNSMVEATDSAFGGTVGGILPVVPRSFMVDSMVENFACLLEVYGGGNRLLTWWQQWVQYGICCVSAAQVKFAAVVIVAQIYGVENVLWKTARL